MTAIADLLARCAEIPVRIRNTGIYFLLLDGEIVYVAVALADIREAARIHELAFPTETSPS